ncbi:MAG: UvrD-helicase domain-containing protein, partial [Deltaproteobacteria bacterium]|nr:UvrD-helicase domain-containing protein [Deltaproteobacteria bacterium]
MDFIADLHIHSRFSRATSRKLDLPLLDYWARRKGLHLIGTGDVTHPEWLAETREQLIESEEGLYRLKQGTGGPSSPEGAATRFVLSAEISSIYKKNGRVRKIHSLILLPNFEVAENFSQRLDGIGNIRSDGRPILGLDAKDLLELCLDTSQDIFFIPAHIWTPWFSLFGSKSGFDSVEECFEDLSEHIFALETGLSSDPAMNWRLSSLDGYTLVSNSDAHSAAKLGREANLFATDFSFSAMIKALKGRGGFQGTIEFFPEEGKYHLDGHRKCGQRLEPEDTVRHDGLCPVCGKPVTLGVMYRVLELADRPAGARPPSANPFNCIVPLPEVLSEIVGVGPQSKKVGRFYDDLLDQLGPELYILLEAPIEDITTAGGELLGLGIKRMRNGEVHLEGGYDGEFGKVRLFDPTEMESLAGQNALFTIAPASKKKKTPAAQKAKPEPRVKKETPRNLTKNPAPNLLFPADPLLDDLNDFQLEAVIHDETPLCIAAGPGTGKTLVLTRRICWLIREGLARPNEILGITFTRKAREEMSSRL